MRYHIELISEIIHKYIGTFVYSQRWTNHWSRHGTHIMEEMAQERTHAKGWEYDNDRHFRNWPMAEWAVRIRGKADRGVAEVFPVTESRFEHNGLDRKV